MFPYMTVASKKKETDLVRQSNELHIKILLHSCALKTLRFCKALPNAEHVRSESRLEVGERSGTNVVTNNK